jgi:hypothetical protein
MKSKKAIDLEKGDTLLNMFDYLCSKVNWGNANLDNDAVVCMNTLFIELKKDKRVIVP